MVTVRHNHTGCIFYGVSEHGAWEGTYFVCGKAVIQSDTQVLRIQSSNISIQELKKYLQSHVRAVLVSSPFVLRLSFI
jgi:hypothetical protein